MWLLVSLGKDAGDAAFRDKHIVVTLLGLSPKEARIQLCRQPTGSARWRDESVECGDGPGLSSQSGSGLSPPPLRLCYCGFSSGLRSSAAPPLVPLFFQPLPHCGLPRLTHPVLRLSPICFLTHCLPQSFNSPQPSSFSCVSDLVTTKYLQSLHSKHPTAHIHP